MAFGRTCFLLLPFISLLAPIARTDDKLCHKCDTTGRIPNEIKQRGLAELESQTLLCSWQISRDKQGKGLPFLACRKCLAPSKAAEVQREFDALAADVDPWMEGCASIDKHLRARDELVHIKTEHFDLVFGLHKVVLSKKLVLRTHEAAHLYAKRLEEFYDWYQELIGFTDEEVRVLRHQVFLLDDLRTLKRAADEYAMAPTDHSSRAVGDPSVYVTWYDQENFKSDPHFHRHVVHNISHQMVGVFYLKIWLVERAGWLEEGLANACEMRRFEISGNSCNTEQDGKYLSDGHDWEPLVKKAVLTGKTISFADIRNKRADMLTAWEHPFAWSFTDFLMERNPKQLPELIRRLKADVDVRDCLRDLYDLTVLTFDEAWAEWVKETYRLKPRVRRG